jgi:hypothetical protein
MRDRLPMIFSTTALLVAVLGVTPLGDAAYNAVLPRNSVGTLQLQRNAVKAAKIAPNAIRTGHVLDGTLLTADFKAGQIPQGPKGDKGEKGDKGDKGNAGATNVVVRWGSTFTGPGFASRVASCSTGEVAVGGGGGTTTDGGSLGSVNLVDSKPRPLAAGGTPTGWSVGLNITSGATVAAYVICARP